ncbi:MAG: ABC transporter permease, partial [Actinomycetota bacterium]|nr:ABC transporter permease [Actinomycetota bacterium]
MLRYRFLFEQMVRRELRQKYKGSALGVLWYLINPLVLMGAYALVFSVLLRVADIPDYPLFLLVGLIVWVFFAQALLAAAPSLVQNAALVRKVRFPREAIPASVATVQLITFLVMLAIATPVALAVRGTFEPALLLLVPIVALLFCFVLGLSLAVSVLHAHYRDVEPVLGAALLPW